MGSTSITPSVNSMRWLVWSVSRRYCSAVHRPCSAGTATSTPSARRMSFNSRSRTSTAMVSSPPLVKHRSHHTAAFAAGPTSRIAKHLHTIFTPLCDFFTPPIVRRDYYRLTVMGLLALALVGVALALALGFAISIWWLRPQRTLGARGAPPMEPVEPIAPTER